MKKILRKSTILCLILSISFLIFIGTSANGNADSGEDSLKIRIGYQPTVFYSFLFLAEGRGMFKDANLNVELIKIPSANKMYQAFLAGQLDMTGLTATEILLRAYEKKGKKINSPLMVEVNGVDIADRIIVLKNSPIKTVDDLKGKRIGAHPGTTVANIMRNLLMKHGVEPDSVMIQTLKPNLQVNALLSEAVDAIICLEPTGTTLLKSNKCRVLFNHPFGFIEENFPASYTVLSNEFIQKNPETAERLVKVIRDVVTIYQKEAKLDKGAIDKVVAKKMGLDPEIVASIAMVTYRLPEEWRVRPFNNVINFYKNMGILTRQLKIEDIKYKKWH